MKWDRFYPFPLALAGAVWLSPEEEESGMLRMSLLDHLAELRTRILRALVGLAVAYVVCLLFANSLWGFLQKPAQTALAQMGMSPAKLVTTEATEPFSILWVKLPLVASLFLGSPWVAWQLWAFIAPGLYRRERRLAAPFALAAGGLFLAGGLFGYFVVFSYGLRFLLEIGRGGDVAVMVTMSDYFDRLVNVTLGVGLVFELPVVLFLLTLLRVVSPRFLLHNSRYAVIVILILAAVVTPTTDFVNMMLFAVPMTLLFFAGVLASYVLEWRRRKVGDA